MWKLLLCSGWLPVGGFILYVLYRRKNQNDENQVADVVWINELTRSCAVNHMCNSYSIVPENKKCHNPYCTENNMHKIINYIDSAKYSLDLAMYTLNSVPMMNAVKRAHSRKVIVRFITDKEMVNSTRSQAIALQQFGVPVRFPLNSSSDLMHHKFCIIDGVNRARFILKRDGKKLSGQYKIRSILMNGSTNWTHQGFTGSWENILITGDKAHIVKFEDEFERMWKAFDKIVKLVE